MISVLTRSMEGELLFLLLTTMIEYDVGDYYEISEACFYVLVVVKDNLSRCFIYISFSVTSIRRFRNVFSECRV